MQKAVSESDVLVEGQPLFLKAVAHRLHLGVREIARAAGLGSTTMHMAMSFGLWPTRRVIRRDRIVELLRKSGATESELETIFDPIPPESDALPKAGRRPKANPQPQEETDMLMGKQSLSMAARKAFSLFSNPFDGEVSSEAEMFVSGEIRFIREACWQTAINGAFVAVMGESGAGKTTIMADLKDRIQSSNRPIIVIEPSVLGMGQNDRVAKVIKSGDILAACIATLDPTITIKQTLEGRTRQFIKMLDESVKAGNSHMLVIEEAHDMPKATFRHLKRLHEKCRIGRRSALGILLVAQPELRNMLNERAHDLREVFQRCEMLELLPLDKDLRAYLEHKAKVGGKQLDELITDDGIDAIRERMTVERRIGGGQNIRTISLLYPLAVNNLMTAALNVAAELGAPVINKDIVKAL